jgi:hypothetical protein
VDAISVSIDPNEYWWADPEFLPTLTLDMGGEAALAIASVGNFDNSGCMPQSGGVVVKTEISRIAK